MKTNTYIIRKAVKARNINEALRKEKNSAILDIILVHSAKKSSEQLMPAIGFTPSDTTEYEGDE